MFNNLNLSTQIEDILTIENLPTKIVIILAISFIVNLFSKIILNNAEKAVKKTKGKWDDAFFEALKKPVSLIIWLTSLKFIFDVFSLEFYYKTFNYANIILKILVILNISWFLLRLIKLVAQNYIKAAQKKQNEADHTTIDAISKLARLTVFIITILTIFQNVGVSISGILAAGGIGGLAIGFAAKDLLSNLFGGLTIYLDKPFKVGDWVRCSEKNIEGTVEYIGWRHTRIRAFNKNPIYVPNAVFTTIVVENPSRMTNRRIKEVVGIRYCDISKMAKITKEVKEMLQNHPEIDTEQTLIVNFSVFNASSVDFMVYCFTKTVNWIEFAEIKQDVLLKISDIVEKNQSEIAFPTRTIYMEK